MCTQLNPDKTLFRTMFLLMFITFFACKNRKEAQEKFDRVRWAQTEGTTHPYRDNMFADLMKKRPWQKKNRAEVLGILGQPDRSTPGYLYYTVKQKFLFANFPMHTESLVIKFGADSLVEWAKIHK